MAREMFNPAMALFVNVPAGGTTFQPNPSSTVQNDPLRGTTHLDYFKFCGHVVAKALWDGQLLDAHFTQSFYKHIVNMPISFEDVEAVDPDMHRNLKWMKEHDITDVFDTTFTAEQDFFGWTQVVDLVPGGSHIPVTEENKEQYVRLMAKHIMTGAIREQITAFQEGFWEVVPSHLIAMFHESELELLISGLPDIDVDDLRANTEYVGFSAASPVVQWFWEILRDMDQEDKARFVQFVTGTSKVPLEGFKALQGVSGPQRFQIQKAYGDLSRLPQAHTCFNQLDLYEYENKEQLRDRLMKAVHEGYEGFGFA